jgi:hypothetical protein
LGEQLNNISSSSNKRFSVPVCNQSLKPRSSVVSAFTPRDSSSIIKTSIQHNYGSSSNRTAKPTDNPTVTISVKPIVRKSYSTIGISRVSFRLIF